jgi:hypothetical protein
LTTESQAIEQQRHEAEAEAKRAANSTHTRRASLRYLKELQVRTRRSPRPRRLRYDPDPIVRIGGLTRGVALVRSPRSYGRSLMRWTPTAMGI